MRREKISKSKFPRCVIIAGPNGAGKTTFAREFLPKEAGIVHFVNADLLAAGLSPVDVLRRFERGWKNFVNVYRLQADTWTVHDNSSDSPVLVQRKP